MYKIPKIENAGQNYIVDDYTLIRTFQDGDKDSFRLLVNRYNEKVRNLIYRVLSENSSIDDLAQDVFIKVYESLNNFRFESSFYTWLYRITINKCRDEIRRKKLRKFASLDFIFTNGVEMKSPNDQYEKVEGDILVSEALSKLSSKQREIIILKDLNDLSYQEISEILNCEVGTVKSRLSRARIELAKIMKKMIGYNVASEEKNKTSLGLSR
jgi:RNA polymerase sigma-70 factor (ECF subfamily)